EAKIHLAAADYMIIMYYISLITDPDDAKSEEKIYNYDLIYMFINQLWAMYGIMLLRSSKERLLQHESNKSCEPNNIESECHLKLKEEIMKPLTFVDLEKDLKTIIKYHITDAYVSDLDDINIILTNVIKWLNVIYMHFKGINQFIPQMQIILCMSKAYKYYVYFEESKIKQIKVIEQQAEMLESFINILISEYNTSLEYHYLKKLNFELAITYSTLLDMTSEKLDEIE
ncbi:Protein KBP-like protein, partial [Camponotus floridanus]